MWNKIVASPALGLGQTVRNAFKKFNWEFASGIGVWNTPFYIYCGIIAQVFSGFTHVGGPSSQLVLVFAIRFTLTCANTLVSFSLTRLFFARPKTVGLGLTFNLVLIGLIGALDNAAYGVLLHSFHVFNLVPIQQRAVSSLILGPILFILFVSGYQGNLYRIELTNKVLGFSQELNFLLQNSGRMVLEEMAELSDQMRARLTPRLDYIQELIAKGNSGDAVGVLRFINQSDVRPAAREIESSQEFFGETKAGSLRSPKVAISATYKLSEALKPWTVLLLSLVQYLVLTFAARLAPNAGDMAVILVAFVLLLVVKANAKHGPSRDLKRTIAIVCFVLLFCVSVGWILLEVFKTLQVYQFVACLSSLTVSIVITSTLRLISSHNRQLTAELLELKTKIKSSISLLRQEQWIGRRRLVSQIHGEVQGALVAATTRLSLAQSQDDDQVSLALSDLDRAIEALGRVPETNADFGEAAQNLVDAWAGVCDIKLDVRDDARELLGSSPSSSFVVMAMFTEAVVNAVHHGGANKVKLTVTVSKPGTLEVEMRDNGQLKSEVVWGTGIKEMIAMTTKFSFNRQGDETVVKGELPIILAPHTQQHLEGVL